MRGGVSAGVVGWRLAPDCCAVAISASKDRHFIRSHDCAWTVAGVLCNATPVNRTGGVSCDQYPRAITSAASRTTVALSLAKWFCVHRYGQQTHKNWADGQHNDREGALSAPHRFSLLCVYVRDHLITLVVAT